MNWKGNHGSFWSDDRIEQARDLWENHLEISAEAIGQQLGCSKSAVIGIANRKGFKPRGKSAVIGIANRKGFKPRGDRQVTGPQPTTTNDPFASIGPNDCRFPIGNPGDSHFHFCGAPAIETRPYCLDHCKRAYISPKRAKEIAEAWTEEKRAAAKKRFVERSQAKHG